MRERAECRLVLFRDPQTEEPMLDVNEFPALAAMADRMSGVAWCQSPNFRGSWHGLI